MIKTSVLNDHRPQKLKLRIRLETANVISDELLVLVSGERLGKRNLPSLRFRLGWRLDLFTGPEAGGTMLKMDVRCTCQETKKTIEDEISNEDGGVIIGFYTPSGSSTQS